MFLLDLRLRSPYPGTDPSALFLLKTGNLAEVVEITRGTTKLTAGYTSGIAQILPIVLTPALGLFFDRYGRRTQFIAGTAALWVLVFSLLNFSSCHPLIP